MSICYQVGGPPALPLVKFDNYTGPILPDNTVPINPIRRTQSSSGEQCSLPLKLAWAMTIRKAESLTLDKLSLMWGKRNFVVALHM